MTVQASLLQELIKNNSIPASYPAILSHPGSSKSEKLSILFEEWLNAGENWDRSSLVISLRQQTSFKKLGCRRWFTRDALAEKYKGDYGVADSIIAEKQKDSITAGKCVRDHPDLPGDPKMKQFLCFDEGTEADEEDHILSSLIECKTDTDKKSGKDGKGKKRKKSSSSRSSSSSSPSQVTVSSESESRKNSKKKKNKKGGSKKSKKDGKNKKDKKSKKLTKEQKEKAEEQRRKREIKEEERKNEKAKSETRSKAKKVP